MEKNVARKFAIVILAATALFGCAQALQRGMLGDAYISTARPAISLQAKGMPLLASGEGFCNMSWTGVLGGLPIQMWMAVYGSGGVAPLAIVAQAQVPNGWYWDSSLARPFSVDHGTAAFNGVTYEAFTYMVDKRDPFGALVAGVQPDGQPQKWIARAFAARYNFNQDKIILEYREPLPEQITDLANLPLGSDSFLRDFARRAQAAFEVGPAPANPSGVKKSYIQGVQWQYMGQGFLGTVSKNEILNQP